MTWQASEKQIATAVLEHWLKLGEPNTMVACIPNAFAHGQAGLTPGLPDLLVIGPHVPTAWAVGGVGFIELKRDANSKPTKAQYEFQRLCHLMGVAHMFTAGRDEPIAVLEGWRVVRKAAA
jgi:hypothetical protein